MPGPQGTVAFHTLRTLSSPEYRHLVPLVRFLELREFARDLAMREIDYEERY